MAENTGKKVFPAAAFGLLPAVYIILEWLLRARASLIAPAPGLSLVPLGVGLLLAALTSTPSTRKARTILTLALAELGAVLYLVAYFIQETFRVFMDPGAIFTAAGDAVGGFGGVMVTVFTRGMPTILLFHLPVVLAGLLLRKLCPPPRFRLCAAGLLSLAAAAAILLGCFFMTRSDANRAAWQEEYRFDTAVRNFGLMPALGLDLRYAVAGNPWEDEFVFEDPLPDPAPVPDPQPDPGPAPDPTPDPTPDPDPKPDPAPTPDPDPKPDPDPTPDPDPVPDPPEPEYGWNMLDIDFAALQGKADKNEASLHKYVSSLSPSRQNKYTGLFAGKNLILITAEAFSAEVIHPELTPTLYRLANKGIRFTDFYQPAWGGSTSSGEYSLLTGLIPAVGGAMQNTIGKAMPFTIGNQLQDLGYFSRAYHNNTYTYYNRHLTHENLGYERFIGMGNGMEEGVRKTWPESDLEMLQFTVPQYIDQQPFSVYYMTVSGHCLYTTSGNTIARRHFDRVQHLEASDFIKSYYATQLDLEDAMAHLVASLEAAGIADDTVIVIASDHYPYGLEEGTAWETDRDYLQELYGYPADSNPARDHSALIIWSGCLEDSEPIVVDTPTYSLDLLPTLCNLFGVEYDSRLLVGRDVFSDQQPLVIWADYDWMSELGYYDASKAKFTPKEGVTVPEDHISRMKSAVRNKFTYSKSAIELDYFSIVMPE